MAWHLRAMNSLTDSLCFSVRAACVLLAAVVSGCTLAPVADRVPAVEPRIVSVAQWGGTAADASRAKLHVPTRITLHHGGETFPRSRDPREYLRSLQTWSRNDRKWLDIPYHYLIDLDGNIYAGRDIGYAGDTNTDYDPAGHALVVVLGNYEEIEPTPVQLAAVVDVMSMLAARFRIDPVSIGAHKDFARNTLCPGKHLYPYVQSGYFRDQVRIRLAR